MIRRINKLKNVGCFAELKSQGGTQGDFAKLNVIYAPNAAGKTTLCDVFRSLGTGDPAYVVGRKRLGSTTAIEIEMLLDGMPPTPKAIFQNGAWALEPAGTGSPSVMVYDDRFVADNVLIGQFVAVEQRRNLYGLALGSQGRLLKDRVDRAEQDLSNATSALNSARSALMPLMPAGWTPDTFRPLQKDDSIDQKIKATSDELEAAKRAKQNADSIRQRKALGITAPPAIPDGLSEALNASLDEATLQAEVQVREHLQRHSHNLGLDWAGQGHKGQSGTTCPYCGQEMEGLQILTAYRAFFSGVLQEQQATLRRISEATEAAFGSVARQQLEQLLVAHTTERDWWRDAGGAPFELPACPSLERIRAGMEAVHQAVRDAIQRKQALPGTKVQLNDAEQESLAKWTEISSSLSNYMAALAPISAAIAERQRAAGTVDIAALEKRLEQLLILKKRHEPQVVAAFDAFDAAAANKSRKEKEKAAANQALREQSEEILKEYGGRINDLLKLFQVDFRLISTGVNFLGGPPAGELAVEIHGTRVSTSLDDARNPSRPSLANTLSGGDRSALGLAYFIAVAERDPNIANTVVIIDDPFHSQDRSRRGRTIECVHRVASASKQCFVLSHELDFAREAACLAGVQVHTFTLDPMADHSVLQAGDLPALPSRTYERDYAKLTAFLAAPQKFSTQLKDVARSIRQTLEAYLRTKFPQAWEKNDWLGDMIRKIGQAQPGDPLHHAAHLVADLTQVNNWGKRYYHGETDGSDAGEVDARELKGYVEQTIKIISC
jgi:wobble nucleotide-excising tRNase